MNCKNIKNMISEYIDSELSINQNKKVEEHIKTCPDCKKYFNEIKGVKEFISSSAFYDLSFDKAKKLAKLVREKSIEIHPTLIPKPIWSRWQFISIISVLAILILGTLVLRTYGPYFASPILMEKAAQEAEELSKGATISEETTPKEFGNGEDTVEGEVKDEEVAEAEQSVVTEEGIVERELITIKPGVFVPQPIITVSENDYTQNYIDEFFTKQKSEERISTQETIEQILPIDSNQVLLIKDEYDKILYKSIKSKVLQFPHFDENLKILESEIYKYLTGQEQLPEKFPLLIFSVEKARFEGKDAFIISGIGPGKDFEKDKLTKQFVCVIEAGTNKILHLKTID
ncbi:MAG: zf-HC2 domain-containing protein [Actinobacteria bacterium]|nr:zf-HC2 domain-containing protein [Actinomycetota bacterium]